MKGGWGVQGLSLAGLEGLEGGDEVEEAAKMTEELQMKNWAENHECVWPESQTKKIFQEKRG